MTITSWLLCVLLIFNALDVLTTWRALAMGGVEANPFVNALMRFSKRPLIGLLLSKLVMVVMLALIWHVLTDCEQLLVVLILSVLYVLVVNNNLRLIKNLSPINLNQE